MALFASSIAAQLNEAEQLHIFDYDPPGMLVVNVQMIDSLELLKRTRSALGPDHVCDQGYVSVSTWLTHVIEPLRDAMRQAGQ